MHEMCENWKDIDLSKRDFVKELNGSETSV